MAESATKSEVKRSPKLFIYLFTISVGLILAVFVSAVVAFIILTRIDFDPEPFDSSIWISSPSDMSHKSKRLQMVDDLLRDHLATGMTRHEVVSLLGEPDDTTYMSSYDLVYHLGLERGFMAIDSEWLVIRLDEHDVVTEAKLTRD